MNKKMSAAMGIALSVCLAGTLAACGFGDIGKADDMYPYDVALSEGYQGSEGSWLAESTPSSTVYRRMWEEAVADGSFTGTYFEFLSALDLGNDSAYLQRSLLSVVSITSHMSTSTTSSAGAGVILSIDRAAGDMEVLTNYHVVYDSTSRRICNELTVYLYGGEISSRSLSATFVGGSAAEDIALLRIEGDDEVVSAKETHTNAEVVKESAAQAAEIGASDSLLVGDRVYAIGNPEAWGIAVAEGVVSVDAEYITMDAIDGSGQVNMIELRTDAIVNHGNSGGGLFNEAGELVGIVNARSEASGVDGIGYAIPIDHAMAVVGNLKANGGTVKLARLGITVETAESRSAYDAASGRTFISEKIIVRSAENGSAALSAGIEPQDTFISMTLNGRTVNATRRYMITDLLLDVRMGDTLSVVVTRGNAPVTLTVRFDKEKYFEERP